MSIPAWGRVCLAMFAVGWGANQFSPMLLVYRDEIGLTASTRAALFGVYAAGLIPGLLWGGRASTGADGGRWCFRSSPCRRWPR